MLWNFSKLLILLPIIFLCTLFVALGGSASAALSNVSASPTVTKGSSASLTFTSTSATECLLAGPSGTIISWTACTSGWTANFGNNPDGLYGLYVREVVAPSVIRGAEVTRDRVAPTISATCPSSVSTASVTCSISTSDDRSGVNAVTYSTIYNYGDGLNTGYCPTSGNCTISLSRGTGNYSITFWVYDRADNQGSDSSGTNYTPTPVITPPSSPTIGGSPSAGSTVYDGNYNFTVSSNKGSGATTTLYCSLNGASYTECGSGSGSSVSGSYSGSNALLGTNTFSTYAQGSDGGTSGTSTSTWTRATFVPPVVPPGPPTFNGTPEEGALVGNTNYNFTFTATQGTGSNLQFFCSLNGGTYYNCTNGTSGSNAREGSNNMTAYSSTSDGTSGTSTRSWIVDTTPPNTTITTSPPSLTNSTAPSFSFSSSEGGSTFQCSLDGASWESCSSSKSYSGLSDGSHNFRVRASDALGNTDPTPASYSWIIDTTPPNTTILTTPLSPTSSTSADFSFSSSEGGSGFKCKLNSGSWADCESPKNYTGLSGTNTFQVQAIDAANNIDDTPASYTWTIDTAKPSITLFERTDPSPSNGNVINYTLSFDEDVAGVEKGDFFNGYAGIYSGAVCNFTPSGNGSSYTVEASCSQGGYLGLAFAAEGVIDAAGNTGPAGETRDSLIWVGPPISSDGFGAKASISGQKVLGGTLTAETEQWGGEPSSYRYQWQRCTTNNNPATCSAIEGETSGTYTIAAEDNNLYLRVAVWASNSSGESLEPVYSAPTDIIDAELPAKPATTESPSALSASTSASFSFGGEVGATFLCSLDSPDLENATPCDSPQVYNDLSQGEHTFRVWQKDAAGNISEEPESFSWTVDNISPSASWNSAPSSPNRAASLQYDLEFSEDVSGLGSEDFQNGGDAIGCEFEVGGSGKDYTITVSSCGEGTLQPILLSDSVSDEAGNEGPTLEEAGEEIVIDKTAPTASWNSAPSSPTNSLSLFYQFSVSEKVSDISEANFQNSGSATGCSFDTKKNEENSYSLIITGCSEGTVIPTIKQDSLLDDAGNAGPSEPSSGETVLIDRTPPDMPLIAGEEGPTNKTELSFSPSGEGDASFFCKMESEETWQDCNSGMEYSDLPEGEYVFEAKQRDRAGNESAIRRRAFNIDRTPPSKILISQAPRQKTNTRTAFFFFDLRSYEDGADIKCRLSGEWQDCPGGRDFGELAEGSYTFEVKQVDKAGNDSVIEALSFTIDRTPPPKLNISEGPRGATNSDIAFQISREEVEAGSEIKCKLLGDWEDCFSELEERYDFLTDGTYTFFVKQIDEAGNESAWEERSFTLDRIAPESPNIDSHPQEYTNSLSPSFAFSGEDGGRFECHIGEKLEGEDGLWEECHSSYTKDNLPEGWHTFSVRQWDDAGNMGAEKEYRFYIDRSAPEAPEIPGSLSGAVSSLSASLSFAGEDHARFQCQVNGGEWRGCTSPKKLSGLSQGLQTFAVRQYDRAGNASEKASTSWIVDTIAPSSPSITSAPPEISKLENIGFTFTGEAEARFQCKINGNPWRACDSPQSYSDLPEGSHVFRVRQRDEAGNFGPEGGRIFQIDRTAPLAPAVHSGPSGRQSSSGTSFGFSGERGARIECRLDSGQWEECSSPKAYRGLSNGEHTFQTRQSDAAGNISETTSRVWTVDTTIPPAPEITSAPSGFVSSSSASIEFTGDRVQCKLDSEPWRNCTSPETYSNLSEGSHIFRVRSRNEAGNSSATKEARWITDTISPEAPTIFAGPLGSSSLQLAAFSFSGETGSPFECRLGSGPWTDCHSPQGYGGLSQGEYTFSLRQRDAAGNIGPVSTRSWVQEVASSYLAPLPKLSKLKIIGPRNIAAGKRALFRIQLQNRGIAPARKIKITLWGGGQRYTRGISSLAAGGRKVARFRIRIQKAGRIVIRAQAKSIASQTPISKMPVRVSP